VLAADAVVLYQEDGEGWQEQRFAVADKPLAAEIAVDDQGAAHLVYEVRNPGSQSHENDIYYARQTCQLARR
jgi:hypothetical protein